MELDSWTLADGKNPFSYFGFPTVTCFDYQDSLAFEELCFQTHNIQSLESLQARVILKEKARQLAIDASPAFVLATGRAVDGMLASNVADYLEFKSVEGLMWLDTTKAGQPLLSRVPCNKNDVFSTKLLSPLDKRRLMKFLQLAMDYATQMSVAEEILKDAAKNRTAENDKSESITHERVASETEVQSLNERHLNQGRSLARPQNKAVATDELKKLQAFMEKEDSNFDDYLQTQHKLSPKLRDIIRYALAMEGGESSSSVSHGMSQLRHHLQALGRYGTTAFLMPMYGSGELSQAFCRSAAVFGSTYLLRRAPTGIVLDPETKIVDGVRIAADTYEDVLNSSQQNEKVISCDNVVLPGIAMAEPEGPSSKKAILRRVSLINGRITGIGDQRHVIVIPPKSINGHANVIHGVTLDDSIYVSPPGCTMLHLTTTMENSDNLGDTTVLDEAASTILASAPAPLVEFASATFTHAAPFHAQRPGEVGGIHICSHSGQVLAADAAFEQAEKIFHKICPGQDFLGLSDDLDAVIKERSKEQGHEDEERLMLESALGMIGDNVNEQEPRLEEEPQSS